MKNQGGFTFFQSSKPNFPHIKHRKGKEIVTNQGGNYVQILFDTYGFVQSLTYLGKGEAQVQHWSCLIGKHHKILNNLISRFDEGLILDLIK